MATRKPLESLPGVLGNNQDTGIVTMALDSGILPSTHFQQSSWSPKFLLHAVEPTVHCSFPQGSLADISYLPTG